MMDQITHILISVFHDTSSGVFVPAAEAAHTGFYGAFIGNDYPVLIVFGYFFPFFFFQVMYDQVHNSFLLSSLF
jgi:hypothetical protein